MSAGHDIIKQRNRRIRAARDWAANELISMSVKLDQMIDDKNIDSLDKYNLRDANDCIKKAIRRIKPLRPLSELSGYTPN